MITMASVHNFPAVKTGRVVIVQSVSQFRGDRGVSAKKRDPPPPTLSSAALLSKKIKKKIPKSANIVQNHGKLSKVPKTGPNGLFKRFLSVFLAYKY
jgi:hypothetical protein